MNIKCNPSWETAIAFMDAVCDILPYEEETKFYDFLDEVRTNLKSTPLQLIEKVLEFIKG